MDLRKYRAMSDNLSNNKRIAKNTIVLYLRMFLVVGIGLYTSRVVLATLGVEDYGIYGVVGSIVAMLGFLNSAMSTSTSRFLTYEMGQDNIETLQKTYSSAMMVHYIIAIIVFVVSETIGLWFLCNKLVIPENRILAAHIVYQISIVSAMLTITQVPYNASIIAHEKMDIYAYVEILNVALKLLIVYLLTIGDFDKLILYAILMFAISFMIRVIYRIYVFRHFEECKFKWMWDENYIKPLLGFSGWSLYPSFCFTARQQGINFIINIFGGAAVNAASSLATTIFNIVEQFSTNILTASRPPIIKLYAKNEHESMLRLTQQISSVASVLYGFIALPVILECHYLLSVWLVNVPYYTEGFCILLLISTFFSLNNNCLYTIIQANGNIRLHSLLAGSTALLVLPILYVVLHLGGSLYMAYILSVVNSSLIYLYCLIIVKKHVPHFAPLTFAFSTLLKSIICFIPIIMIVEVIQSNIEESFYRLVLTTSITTIMLSIISVSFIIPRNMLNKFLVKIHLKNK